MTYEFGVTLSSSLNEMDVQSNSVFKHTHVLDLRRCVNNGPMPIEEKVLRKLANFRIGYEQIPMTLNGNNSRQQNELFRTITEQSGNVLVLTDEVIPMARFCQQLDIPFSGPDLRVVETANDSMPIQITQRPEVRTHFGSLAS